MAYKAGNTEKKTGKARKKGNYQFKNQETMQEM